MDDDGPGWSGCCCAGWLVLILLALALAGQWWTG